MLPKLRSFESTLQPINRLPDDILILIPRFFTDDGYAVFPMNKPLVAMTGVCRSWRNLLLSTPSLWTQLNFSNLRSKQQEVFLERSGKQLLDICLQMESEEYLEPFLSATLRNSHRLRWLDLGSTVSDLDYVLTQLTRPAPELKHLEIWSDGLAGDLGVPSTIFGGQLPKLTSFTLLQMRTDLRGFNFPALKRFILRTEAKTSVQNLTSFFERCPLLVFIQICLTYTPEPPIAPPGKRIRLAALKELRFNETALTSGLLDHLTLPNCTEIMLKGQFLGKEFDDQGNPAARIHPTSLDHLPTMRGITKAVAMPNSCILSGPNGYLRFWFSRGTRENFDAEFFTSLNPISVSGVRELWVGATTEASFGRSRWGRTTGGAGKLWSQTPAGVRGAFGVLAKVEDLIIVNCNTEPIFVTLGVDVDNVILLPGLHRLTIYVGSGDLDAPALIQCVKARNEHSMSLGEVAIVFEKEPGADVIRGLEPLRELVVELDYRVGVAPVLRQWESRCDDFW